MQSMCLAEEPSGDSTSNVISQAGPQQMLQHKIKATVQRGTVEGA